MLWIFVCRLVLKKGKGGGSRVIIRVPLGDQNRARMLVETVGCGRRREGAAEFEGHSLERAVVELGLPEELVPIAQQISQSLDFSSGGRGYRLPKEQRAEQAKLAMLFKETWSKCVRRQFSGIIGK